MTAVQWLLYLLGVGLQIAIITVLLRRREYRSYPLLLAYCLCLTLTTGIEFAIWQTVGNRHPVFFDVFWVDELIRQSGVFAVVISLIIGAVPESQARKLVINLSIAAAVVFWVTSLLIHRHDRINTWMSAVVRDLSFSSAILNLGLWFWLVRNLKYDFVRLLIAGGLGMQTAGEALGQSLRLLRLSRETYQLGGILTVVTHLLCMAAWWFAVARAEQLRRRGEALSLRDGDDPEAVSKMRMAGN